jgi:hypothetical protein
MKRYHEEKHIVDNRVRRFKQLTAYADPEHEIFVPDPGRFRKTLRCAGCGRARCQLCHSDKFPKRIPTRKEQQAKDDLKE